MRLPTRHSPVSLLKLFAVDHVLLDGEITEPLEQPVARLGGRCRKE